MNTHNFITCCLHLHIDTIAIEVKSTTLQIANVGTIVLKPQYGPHKVALQDVCYVPSMKKNLLLVSQLTSLGNYILFILKMSKCIKT